MRSGLGPVPNSTDKNNSSLEKSPYRNSLKALQSPTVVRASPKKDSRLKITPNQLSTRGSRVSITRPCTQSHLYLKRQDPDHSDVNDQILILENELKIGQRFKMPTQRLVERIRDNLKAMEEHMQALFAEDSEEQQPQLPLVSVREMLDSKKQEEESTCYRESTRGSLAGCSAIEHKKPKRHRRGNSYQG